ncbi:MAG: hypothetical protein COA62_04760 [Rhodobiaceae bacterium]|nr:MAG: hypothetical protein COA62_04760 [Rhodobiaceae bacterium]
MNSDVPSAAMMVPVVKVARFMETLQGDVLDDVFVDEGLVIVENFAPHIFSGPTARRDWQQGFGVHARGLSELVHSFGPAQDFSWTGDLAYFSLPTRWGGKVDGRDFAEEGGWAFVLGGESGIWRIKSYVWAVTCFELSSPDV